MDRILESKQLRKIFLAFFGALLAIALLVRFLWLSDARESAGLTMAAVTRIIDGFISSSVVTTILGLVVYLGTSQIRKASLEIEVLASGDINRRFVAAQQNTKTWFFKGGLGRYFTSATLPNVLNNGKSGYRFRAYIVDPFNSELCSYVAAHRCAGQTGDDVKLEVLVTILEYVRHVHARRVDVAEACCGLIDDFAPLRIDLTDEGVYITHDKKSAPATFYRNESVFYAGYDQELTTGPNSYKVIDVTRVVSDLTKEGVLAPVAAADVVYARSVFHQFARLLGLNPENCGVTEDQIGSAVQAASKRKSPY